MNLTLLMMMSGVVLSALLITATVEVANKTVKTIRRSYVQNRISNLLCEVTCKLALERKPFVCTPFAVVAKEVMHPNSVALQEGWKYSGCITTFILSNDYIRPITASFTYGKERFLIWKTGEELYFKSESGIYEHLLPKAAENAKILLKTARNLGKQALARHVSKIPERASLEVV